MRRRRGPSRRLRPGTSRLGRGAVRRREDGRAHPRLGREALHDGRRAAALGPDARLVTTVAGDRGLDARRGGRRRPLPAGRRRPDARPRGDRAGSPSRCATAASGGDGLASSATRACSTRRAAARGRLRRRPRRRRAAQRAVVPVGRGWSRDGCQAERAAPAAVRRPARRGRHRRGAAAGHRRRRGAPSARWLPDGRRAHPRHERPVGQLRGRDAPQGARRAVRRGGSTPAGAGVVRAELDELGVRPRMVDGSGLSRAEPHDAAQVVRLLERMDGQPVAGAFEPRSRSPAAPAPSAGGCAARRRRTAAGRRRARCAASARSPASARPPAGREVAFAFLMNGVSGRLRRPRRAGPDDGGDRPAGRAVAPGVAGQQREQAGLVEHRDAEALGLLELRARGSRRRRGSRSSSTPTRSRGRPRRGSARSPARA